MTSNLNNPIVEQDLILVYIDSKPAFFARIENIAPDIKRGWWRVKLLILQIPLLVTTWILDEEQIQGADFTMSGTPIRLEKVIAPASPPNSKPGEEEKLEVKTKPPKQARIVSLNPKPN